ncbi:hypothetical protein ABE29_01370 [Cytobacillus firmus]|uniref:hypothetical protein n=1 Tax=Cytobacillus firmus TaxID=1399 RepID=UPI000E1AFE77|nr:hypothetical protein [Cytobacillus firmus]MBG9541503.1 hypothetical protein [Cytobacillus firmus]MBG9553711.1 hypothetical protein [Cytobacillus firmus]MBG9556770.1 hypothetical protein [Cytobacillus firmus]MBG9574812.1 hypothetical protein [Cytobacillus firmus]MEC1892539.1 hypothetical protein [Cytobacillus firmus]
MSNMITQYENFRTSLDSLGAYFSDDDIALNFLDIQSTKLKKWQKDIAQILKMARVISHANIDKRNDLSHSHQEIIKLYKESPNLPFIARPDMIIKNGQPKIIELNYDSSAIEGFYEIDYIQTLLLQMQEEKYSNYKLMDGKNSFVEFVKESFKIYISDSDSSKKMAIMIYADMNQYDKDIAQETASWINQNSDIKCFIRSHETLWDNNGVVTDGENEFQLLYMYSTLKDMPSKTKHLEELLVKIHNSKTIILSDIKDIVVDCKLSLAYLYEVANSHEFVFSDVEKNIICEYVPWTFVISKNKKVIYNNEAYDLIELLTSKQEQFVLKKSNSFYVKDVIAGSRTNKDEWINYLEHIVKSDTEMWVAQEFIESDYYDFQYYNPVQNDLYKLARRFVISPYFFDSNIINFLIRVEKDTKYPLLGRLTDGNMGVAFVKINP